MQRAIAVLVTLVSMAGTAHAQSSATTFAELPSRLSIGETVFVTNQSGQTVKGKVQQVTDTILVLRNGSDDLTLAASDVRRIARRGHTLRNGAIIGFAAGFTVGATWAATADDCTYTCFSSPAGVLMFGGLFGSIGMGAGAAVGDLLRREQVVYARAVAGGTRLQTTMLLSRGVAGLRVQIAW